MKVCGLFFLSVLLFFFCGVVVAEDVADDYRLWPMASALLGDNSRFAIDFSSRLVSTTQGGHRNTGFMQQAGVDIHKVFSSHNKDLATGVVQLYAARIDNLNPHPSFFESDHDWELIKKINTINITALSRGSFNILLGHLELPYGLEYSIDTNTTLRQTAIIQNLGIKTDWGGGINGNINNIQYDFVLTRGSGVEYNDDGSPYAITGRFGSAFGNQSYFPSSGWGVSVFHGEFMQGGAKVKRTRAGIDHQWTYGAFGQLTEVSWGQDDSLDRGYLFTELNWTSVNEKVFAYTQLKSELKDTASGWDDKLTGNVGISLMHANGFNIDLQYSKDLRTFENKDDVGQIQLQFRFRF
ncbi:MAG TPA: hypothetical protein EYQ42_05195 [Thiotrichaceae bacterium]|jgi:hypothetical protein|nr:hypothetical protein [Thiotrichaceae bacterium]HIM08674.1 hypothetical protein [Gammaproteobacteria bacterium]